MTRREQWVRALGDPATWGRALRVGAPVGLLQAAIHQGDAWLRLAVDAKVVLKTVVSPLVGFALVWAGAAGALVTKAMETRAHGR
ncbi:MAG TPA: hypothetical protein VF950_10115 [Planctomycetota bacterium]